MRSKSEALLLLLVLLNTPYNRLQIVRLMSIDVVVHEVELMSLLSHDTTNQGGIMERLALVVLMEDRDIRRPMDIMDMVTVLTDTQSLFRHFHVGVVHLIQIQAIHHQYHNLRSMSSSSNMPIHLVLVNILVRISLPQVLLTYSFHPALVIMDMMQHMLHSHKHSQRMTRTWRSTNHKQLDFHFGGDW